MKQLLIVGLIFSINFTMTAQSNSDTTKLKLSPLVDYNAFVELVHEVDSHRQERLISIHEFNTMSQQNDVIILDTRSKEMFDAKHVKGAIHLNFSDFTQENLKKIIPSTDTKILIYCNNNFQDDQVYFATKSYVPPTVADPRRLTLALNIPTYINLYGYGYKNVYELGELISVFDSRIQFEGTAVLKIDIIKTNQD